MSVIHRLVEQHQMLRATYHMDSASDDIGQSYMAVHCSEDRMNNVLIIHDESRLNATIRKPFRLSEEYPVRWVILHEMFSAGRVLQTKCSLHVVGHHIAVDGVRRIPNSRRHD